MLWTNVRRSFCLCRLIICSPSLSVTSDIGSSTECPQVREVPVWRLNRFQFPRCHRGPCKRITMEAEHEGPPPGDTIDSTDAPRRCAEHHTDADLRDLASALDRLSETACAASRPQGRQVKSHNWLQRRGGRLVSQSWP